LERWKRGLVHAIGATTKILLIRRSNSGPCQQVPGYSIRTLAEEGPDPRCCVIAFIVIDEWLKEKSVIEMKEDGCTDQDFRWDGLRKALETCLKCGVMTTGRRVNSRGWKR